ncbi:MAG TPA: MFS transporter [Candidatus Limnocylindrales bacterium]|nr:MFS transporter [Candidatus Limnocylindrales bacterium]
MLLPFTFSATARGLITLYASALLAGMWSMIVPAVPVMATAFAVSPGTAAQTITALAFGRFAGMPLSGAVLDRLGTRAALTVGPALACGAALLAGITPWFSLILGLLFLIGVGESIWVIAREVAGIDLTRQDQRGRVLSGFHGINNLGLALGPLFGGLLTEAVGFRAVFFGYAACAVTSVFLGLAVGAAPTPPPAPSAGVADWGFAALGRRLRGLKDLFEQISPDLRTTYIVLVLATFTSFMHRVTTQSMLPLLATAQMGLSPKEIGMLFTISGFSVFAMILPAGFVIDKVGRKWATVPSTGIPAVAFLLIPFANNFFQLAVLISFLGIANGLSLGSLATSTYDVVPPSARGRLQAARRTLADIGGVAAPLLGGYLADRFNPGVPFLAYAPLLVLSAILLGLLARETLQR